MLTKLGDNVNMNSFNLEIFDIKEVVLDSNIERTIVNMLGNVLRHLEINEKNSGQIIKQIIALAKNYTSLDEYEAKANSILKKEGVIDKIPKKLVDRAELIYSQISPFLERKTVYDFGCGDGRVAELISKDKFDVKLSDIYEHQNIKKTGLPFELFKESDQVNEKDSTFDNTLALTVFHHSSNPIDTIRDCQRITKNNGLVFVIESVYGIDQNDVPIDQKEIASLYASLSAEQQRKINIFFDHFYNRIVHYSSDPKLKVNVPFNFNTPQKWKEIFEKNGFVQEKVIYLGLDQKVVPEFHTLHILRVKK